MLVLLADKLPDSGINALRDLGLEVKAQPDLGAADLPAALKASGAKILVVRSTKVTADAFGAAPDLQLVIRAGAGVNTIDLEAANKAGVSVANCPGKNSTAVAELTMGLMLSLDRNIPDAVLDMRSGRWRKKRYGKARGLKDARLALIGFGAIGREVAARAQAFEMTVAVYDPFLSVEGAHAARVEHRGSIEEVVRDADVISVHVPYGKKTHHLVGAKEIAAMPDGVSFIHTARGGVVDDAALLAAVEAGRVRAAVDVMEQEPAGGEAEFSGPMRQVDGLYATPHIGASTDQAQAATAAEVVRIVSGFQGTGAVANLVNDPA